VIRNSNDSNEPSASTSKRLDETDLWVSAQYERLPEDHELRRSRENYCTICNEFYYDSTDPNFIQCTYCHQWQHIYCANMTGKNLFGYSCMECNDE